MVENCIWCDANFENREELEKHVEEAHPQVRARVKV
jgi:uncharacterized C2H2 Zn-finger protein